MKKNRIFQMLLAAGVLAGSLSMGAAAKEIGTDFFTLDASDEWVCDAEEDISNGSRECKAVLRIPDPEAEDDDLVRVEVRVKQNARKDFVEQMHRSGYDSRAAIQEGAYETQEIAGQSFYTETGSFSYRYMGYSEEMNAYIFFTVGDTPDDPRALELMNTLQFHVPACEDTVIPWYWEGTPYSVEDHTVSVGDHTVTAVQLKMEDPGPAYDIFDPRIAYYNGTVYILNNDVLSTCTIDGNNLVGMTPVEIPFVPDEINVDNNGSLYISRTGSNLTRIQGGEVTELAERANRVSVHPSGEMGGSYSSSQEIRLLDLVNQTEETMDMGERFKMVTKAMFTDNRLLLNGNKAEESGAHLVIYDMSYNEVGALNSENTGSGYYGSVSAAAETANGLIIVDGNMRDIYFTDLNGVLIANIDMKDLFGTSYPWPSGVANMEDGTVLFIMTDERPDHSCDETIVYAVRGF